MAQVVLDRPRILAIVGELVLRRCRGVVTGLKRPSVSVA